MLVSCENEKLYNGISWLFLAILFTGGLAESQSHEPLFPRHLPVPVPPQTTLRQSQVIISKGGSDMGTASISLLCSMAD